MNPLVAVAVAVATQLADWKREGQLPGGREVSIRRGYSPEIPIEELDVLHAVVATGTSFEVTGGSKAVHRFDELLAHVVLMQRLAISEQQTPEDISQVDRLHDWSLSLADILHPPAGRKYGDYRTKGYRYEIDQNALRTCGQFRAAITLQFHGHKTT